MSNEKRKEETEALTLSGAQYAELSQISMKIDDLLEQNCCGRYKKAYEKTELAFLKEKTDILRQLILYTEVF